MLEAWTEFVKGKKKKRDVQEFGRYLMANILSLHHDLANGTYQHGSYQHFRISDPKPRDIHKALVRDRLVHRALYRKLYQLFDRVFISDSYSCRLHKGTHKAINRFREFAYKVSKNNTRTCWVLKCDIRKFFASIDQQILMRIIAERIQDKNTCILIENIIASFNSGIAGKGLPLGNLTSQLFANVYLNELDQFMKHELKAKHYIRYADVFVILHEDRNYLTRITPLVSTFLEDNLKLSLHPNKLYLKTLASGVDFLGWAHFSDHRVLRTSTKKRMMKALKGNSEEAVRASYLGMLGWGNAYKLGQMIERLETQAAREQLN